MTQKQTFFKNIVDSTLSISLDLQVSHSNFKKFNFNETEIEGEGSYFSFTLRSGETKYFFIVNLYKVLEKKFFGNKFKYFLKVETREKTNYSHTIVSYDYATDLNFDISQLKKMFDFLEKRIDEIKFRDEEVKYLKINTELVNFVDKSLTRDEKLTDLLKK